MAREVGARVEGTVVIKLPERPALTLANGVRLFVDEHAGVVDYSFCPEDWAGYDGIAGLASARDKTRVALADHVARSLARKERGRK